MSTLTATHSPRRWWQSRVMRRFLSHRLALLGLLMISLLTLACIVGPYLLPYDSLYIDLRARFSPPFTGDHYLGTDPLGRDIAARLLMAGRISLLVGFFAMVLSILVGTLVGVIAGYRAVLEPRQLGYDLQAFVRLQLSRHDSASVERFVARVEGWEEVVACHALTGDMDYLLHVVVEDLEHFSRFLLDEVLRPGDVADVNSSFVLRSVKGGGVCPLPR